MTSPATVAGAALAGAIAGSFFGATLTRWPAGRSVLLGRSACDSCGAAVAPYDMVPILSWGLLRGRCRHCGRAIDPRHLAAEAAAALIAAVAVIAHPFPLAPATAILGWILILLALLDLEHQWLPDRLTLPLGAIGLAVAALGSGPTLADRLIGAAAGFSLLYLIAIAYLRLRGREGLGGGDPKLFGAIGAWVGWEHLPLVLLGAGCTGLASLLLKRLRGGHISAQDRLPLGTHMAIVAWPVWLVVGS